MSRKPVAIEDSVTPPQRAITPPFNERLQRPAVNAELAEVQGFLITAKQQLNTIQSQYDMQLEALRNTINRSFQRWLEQRGVASQNQTVCTEAHRKMVDQRAANTYSAIVDFSLCVLAKRTLESMNSYDLIELLDQFKQKQLTAVNTLKAFAEFGSLKHEDTFALIQEEKKQDLIALEELETTLERQLASIDLDPVKAEEIKVRFEACQRDKNLIRSELIGLEESFDEEQSGLLEPVGYSNSGRFFRFTRALDSLNSSLDSSDLENAMEEQEESNRSGSFFLRHSSFNNSRDSIEDFFAENCRSGL